jgi:hypothetical protein
MWKPDSECDAKTVYNRNYMREKRRLAKLNGTKVAGWDWHKHNPEKNRAKTAKWRASNPEGWEAIRVKASARRRSTPWGRINNNVWCGIHSALRATTNRTKPGKYERALGYRFADLKAHLQANFLDGMSFENWGAVWEIDHIIPCSAFHFESLEDPRFRECWALSNLRPLWKPDNQAKGSRLE